MKHIIPSASFALFFSMQVLAADAPPSTPGGLTASVFSTTAGEVRWNRSTDDNGAVVGYEVTAIDNAGQRSGTSTVTLKTFGEGTVNTVLAPTGLSSAVYSATAAEIFWERSAIRGLQYEVRRNGIVLGVTDGISWFDDSLARATTYAFEIITLDEADPSAETAIARLGYPVVRDLVDDLVSMNYLSLYYDNESGMLSVLSDGPFYEEFELGCPQGGTVSGLRTLPGSFSGDFDACAFDGVNLTGHLDRVLDFAVFGAGDYRAYTVSFDDVMIDAGDNGRTLY